MDVPASQSDTQPVPAQGGRFGRRFTICAVALLGLACLGTGLVAWRRQATERSYQAALAAIPRGDIEVMRRALPYLPGKSPRARLLQGAIDLRNGHPAIALSKLKLAANDPETALWAQFLAGEALCQLQEYETAITTLRGALQQDPDNVDGHRWLAVATFDIGASAEAIEQLQEVVRLDPADPRAHRMLGLIHTEAEEFLKAIDEYQASLNCSRDQPDIDQILTELATAQVKVHRYADVLTTLEGATATPELESVRAEALYALGRNAEAEQIVTRILRDGETSRALILRGLMLLDAGRAAEAVVPLQRASRSHPEDFEIRAKLTQAHAQAGDAAAAKRELEAFERIKSVRQEIHELTLTAASQPEVADVRYELGLRYQKLGLIPVARKWIRAALALNPEHAAARKALAKMPETTSTSNQN